MSSLISQSIKYRNNSCHVDICWQIMWGVRTIALVIWSILNWTMNSYVMSVEADVLFFFGKVASYEFLILKLFS